jgi:hypothetical protein
MCRKKKRRPIRKLVDLLKNSPYAQKLDSVGLFLKDPANTLGPQLQALLTTHLGNSLAEGGTINRLQALSTQGPALDMTKLDQIAALPLGGRIKINPWDDKAEMVKTLRWPSLRRATRCRLK